MNLLTLLNLCGIAPGPDPYTVYRFDSRGLSRLLDAETGEPVTWGKPIELPKHRAVAAAAKMHFVDVENVRVWVKSGEKS